MILIGYEWLDDGMMHVYIRDMTKTIVSTKITPISSDTHRIFTTYSSGEKTSHLFIGDIDQWMAAMDACHARRRATAGTHD